MLRGPFGVLGFETIGYMQGKCCTQYAIALSSGINVLALKFSFTSPDDLGID